MVSLRKLFSASFGVLLTLMVVLVPSGTAFASNASEIGNVQVGYIPSGLAISPDGTKAYVTSTDVSGSVSVVNIATRTVTNTIAVGSRAYGVAFTPNGAEAYVVNRDSDNVSVINTSTETVVATINVGTDPYGVTMSLDGTRAYVANNTSNTVSVIDTATRTVSHTINVPAGPIYLATNPVSGDVYVTNKTAGRVSKITGTTLSGSQIPVTNAYSVAVSPDGSTIYVGNLPSNSSISVISVASFAQTGTISTGNALYYGIDMTPNGEYLYYPTNNNPSSLNRITASTQTIDTGSGYPLTMTYSGASTVQITPDCQTALVVNTVYPFGGGNGYLTFVSTGLPSCAPSPGPAPTPSPTPALAVTGATVSGATQGVLTGVVLFSVLAGVALVALRRRSSR